MTRKIIILGDFYSASGCAPILSDELKRLFKGASLICLNFEGPISTSNFGAPKIGPSISQSPSILKALDQMGVNLYSLANNHIMDFGSCGLQDTIRILEGRSFVGAGISFEDSYRPVYKVVEGFKLAFLAFSEAQFGGHLDKSNNPSCGYAWVDHPACRQSIKNAKKNCDFLVVQVHAGLEFVELPLPEWRVRYQEMIDLGADIVVGHHPHVLQGVEIYKNKSIYYSIGNFFMEFEGNYSKSTSGGVLTVNLSPDGLSAELFPLKCVGNNIAIDHSPEVKLKLKELSEILLEANSSIYIENINSICLNLWKSYYHQYCKSAFDNFYQVLKKKIRNLMPGLKKAEKNNYLMLLHNSRIESHRWVIDRAIRKLKVNDNGDCP